MNQTIYTIKRDENGYLAGYILAPACNTPEQTLSYETVEEIHQVVHAQYSAFPERVSTRRFDEEVASRQGHTPEIVQMLAQYSEIMGEDLSKYVVYGSPMRPMTAAWAHIPNVVYMPADKALTGYHTYVAVPSCLAPQTVESYELTFVSRPGEEITHA